MMQTSVVIEPFMRRGVFSDPDTAVFEMARAYASSHIQQYQDTINRFQAQYGMSYEEFLDYLQARADLLAGKPDPILNEAIMQEEDDALDWKIARDMLRKWLSIQAEANL